MITARTGINPLVAFSLACLATATHAAPERLLRLPPVSGLDATPALRLASELYTEGDLSACKTECRRVLGRAPGSRPAAFLLAVAESRSGSTSTNELAELCSDPVLTKQARSAARCELADTLLQSGKLEAAFEQFRTVFQSTRSRALLRRSATALARLMREHPSLARQAPGLRSQLMTCADLWTPSPDPRPTSAGPSDRSPVAAPIAWIIHFYRSQISPAIGDRCSLTPSCSEYALRALRKHGLLGLAIYADRAVREPDVVQARKNPVYTNGRRRYPDPLEKHDHWLKKR